MKKTTADGMSKDVYIYKEKQRRGALVLESVKLVFDVMQTVSFMMFIEEEGIQIRGFGIMSLIRENLTEEVSAQIDALEEQCNNLETFVDSWGWIAPYMHGTYSNYVQSTRDEIDAWRAWVISKEAEPLKEYGIRITSLPTNAEIFIDGTNTQQLTPQTFYNLPPRSHVFKLKYYSNKRGDYVYEEATLTPSQYETREYRLIIHDAYTGIRIASSPSGAEIRLDGTWTYKLTPHTFWIPAGTYRFKLIYYSRKLGSLTYEANAPVAKGEVREVRWILD